MLVGEKGILANFLHMIMNWSNVDLSKTDMELAD